MSINYVPSVKKVTGLFRIAISPKAAKLISNLLNDLNATLVTRCQEKAGSSAMDNATALHAVMTLFPGEVQRHAVIEGGTSLMNFTNGLIQYDYVPVEESSEGAQRSQTQVPSESSGGTQKSQTQVPSESPSLSKATVSAADISCGLKHVVTLTYPKAQMDNEITKNVSVVLKNMVEHIAKTSQELGQQKKCVTTLEVQNALAKCFPAQMLIHAQSEGAKCTFQCESGLLSIGAVSKSTDSLKRKTPSSTIKKTKRKAKTTSKKTDSGKKKKVLIPKKKIVKKRSLKTAATPSKKAKKTDAKTKGGIKKQIIKKSAASKKLQKTTTRAAKGKKRAATADSRKESAKRQKKSAPKSVTATTAKGMKRKAPANSRKESAKRQKKSAPKSGTTTTAKGKKRTASADSRKESAKRQKKSVPKSGTITQKIVSAITPSFLKTKTSKSKQSTSAIRKRKAPSPHKGAKKTKKLRKKTKSVTAKKTTSRSKESSKKKQVSKKKKTPVKISKEATGGTTPIQKQKSTESKEKSGPGTKDPLTSDFKTGAQDISKNCFGHTLNPEAANEVMLKLQSLFEEVMAQLELQKNTNIGIQEIRQAILIVFPKDLAALALGHMSRTLFIHTSIA